MKYQFIIDNRFFSPVRDSWKEAAQDAVKLGYATWCKDGKIKMDSTQGGEIKRIK